MLGQFLCSCVSTTIQSCCTSLLIQVLQSVFLTSQRSHRLELSVVAEIWKPILLNKYVRNHLYWNGISVLFRAGSIQLSFLNRDISSPYPVFLRYWLLALLLSLVPKSLYHNLTTSQSNFLPGFLNHCLIFIELLFLFTSVLFFSPLSRVSLSQRMHTACRSMRKYCLHSFLPLYLTRGQ